MEITSQFPETDVEVVADKPLSMADSKKYLSIHYIHATVLKWAEKQALLLINKRRGNKFKFEIVLNIFM
jgi:hypothetical protein